MSEQTNEVVQDDDGPKCETCGKTTCPDADLPGFSEPQACVYLPIYNALRYDRCDYGCGRDITQASIRRDIVPTVDVLVAEAASPARVSERGGIDDLAHEISALLNASYAPDADRELILWRRLTKVSEEAGEVQDALRGWVGENPRKGVTHTRSDVITELLDCAGAALGSVAHLLNEGEPAITELLRERLEFVAGRLRSTKEADHG